MDRDCYRGAWVVYKMADVGYEAVSIHIKTENAIKALPTAGVNETFYSIAWWPYDLDLQDAVASWRAEQQKDSDDD